MQVISLVTAIQFLTITWAKSVRIEKLPPNFTVGWQCLIGNKKILNSMKLDLLQIKFTENILNNIVE